jgi:hypothetical protein
MLFILLAIFLPAESRVASNLLRRKHLFVKARGIRYIRTYAGCQKRKLCVAAEKAQAFVKTSKTKEIRQRGLLRAKFKIKTKQKYDPNRSHSVGAYDPNCGLVHAYVRN